MTVVLWDYDEKSGKAMIPGGHFVDVYVTDYTKADLTIGRKPEKKENILIDLNITDEQARVIERILSVNPNLIHDEAQYGGESCYALVMSPTGESVIAGFNRWGDQCITATQQDDMYRMTANRITFSNSGIEKMDALCAAWIQFRCKYLVPKVKEEQTSTEDELGDLEEHPF